MPKIAVWVNSEFPATDKVPKKSKKSGKKPASKMEISELGNRVEKHDPINNLAKAKYVLTLGISRVGYLISPKNSLRKHLCFRTKWGYAISRQRNIMERRRSHSWIQRKKVCLIGDPPPSAPTMAPRSEAAAKSTKLVKSKSSAVNLSEI